MALVHHKRPSRQSTNSTQRDVASVVIRWWRSCRRRTIALSGRSVPGVACRRRWRAAITVAGTWRRRAVARVAGGRGGVAAVAVAWLRLVDWLLMVVVEETHGWFWVVDKMDSRAVTVAGEKEGVWVSGWLGERSERRVKVWWRRMEEKTEGGTRSVI